MEFRSVSWAASNALTFAPLWSFASPAVRPLASVGQILLERDALIVSVGSRVLAWKARPVGKSAGKGKGIRVASGKNSSSVEK